MDDSRVERCSRCEDRGKEAEPLALFNFTLAVCNLAMLLLLLFRG